MLWQNDMDLRAAREAAGLNMKEAAELSGTPYRTWQNWEQTNSNSRRPPGLAFAWLELWTKLNNSYNPPPNMS
jgi:DNA-binding transcriptional regulator YiaG